MSTYRTLKAARADGYEDIRPEHYGGEQIDLKGHLLVRNPKVAISETAWRKRGYGVPRDADPHAWLTHRIGRGFGGGKRVTYPVFKENQVVPKRTFTEVPPVEVPILAAVWRINRSAKRFRDAASKCYEASAHHFAAKYKQRKLNLYDIKSQALHHLVAEGLLKPVGFHRFDGHLWAEVLKGDGYTFHRPAPEPEEEVGALDIQQIEAKPVGAKEPRLKDAVYTVERFLGGREKADIYEWPPRTPEPEWECSRASDGDPDDDDDDYWAETGDCEAW